MVHTVQHAGPSTEAMLPFSPQSPRSALPALPSHVQAIHDFDPTLLAFTSNGNPNMYLSFSAGDILKVHVRDQTGWWDGEVASAPQPGDGDGRKGPRRGWFPSNYVRDMGWEAVSLTVITARAASTRQVADFAATSSQEQFERFRSVER